MSEKWSQKDIPDLTNKVVIITGANSADLYKNRVTYKLANQAAKS